MNPETACSLCALPDSEWLLGYPGTTAGEQSARETLLTLGNGYLATRGAAPEHVADGTHYPATYVAGVYNRLESEVDGHTRTDESLVNVPSWLALTVRASSDGAWLGPRTPELVHDHMTLDLWRGLLLRELVVEDGLKRTHIRQERLVSMERPHLVALRTIITPQNWSGTLHVRSLLDGRVRNDNVAEFAALAKHHLDTPVTGHDGDTSWLITRTTQSGTRIALSARTTVSQGEVHIAADSRRVRSRGCVGQELQMAASSGTSVTVDKTVAIFTSRDRGISEPFDAAMNEIADAPSFSALQRAHVLAWEDLWQQQHLSLTLLEGEALDEQRALNLHVFHVMQTLSRHTADLDCGVPARGLHGEGYRGHIFWDELFVFPLSNLRVPELSRALLLYRHRRLPQARRLARHVNAAGALFPWQSGSDGREETPEWLFNPRSGRWMADNSRRQHHVNLAVAYNIWNYYQVSQDIDFLANYGAELLVEIARFWAAIAEHDPSTDRYHIRGVMGPDEFHDGYPGRPGAGVDDNAYVAVMTSWILTRVGDVHELLGGARTEGVWQRLGVDDAELQHWGHISRRLHVPWLPNGLMAQFAGYADLDELDWDAYRTRYGDIGRLDLILNAEGDTTNRYQVGKQADVVMLFYLFSAEELTDLFNRLDYDFDPATIPATVTHYLARTTHGSTLSRVVHAWVLSRGDRPASWQLLRTALQTELTSAGRARTGEGIHLGAMAATADILQRCYTGLETRGDSLRLHPRLPDELSRLDFALRYRGHRLIFTFTHQVVEVRALPGVAASISLVINDQEHVLGNGEHLHVDLARDPGP